MGPQNTLFILAHAMAKLIAEAEDMSAMHKQSCVSKHIFLHINVGKYALEWTSMLGYLSDLETQSDKFLL